MKVCTVCASLFDKADFVCPDCGKGPREQNGIWVFPTKETSGSDGFNPENFKSYASLEEMHFWFISRSKLIASVVRKFASNARSFLDLGCGTGLNLRRISEEIHGSDKFVDALRFVQSKIGSKANLYSIDATELPFSEEFALIGAFDVLEHITDDEAVIEKIYQALHPGGIVVLTVPQHMWLWSHWDTMNIHVRRYSRKELSEKCSAAGFEILWTSSYTFLLLPFLIIRKYIGIIKKKLTFDDEAKIHPIINCIFNFTMALERLFLYSGVRFPIGGSRIIVAKKPTNI
jgi:SAM-dependent methyltransferase